MVLLLEQLLYRCHFVHLISLFLQYLNERDRESCLSKQVSSLEKTIAFLEKVTKKKINIQGLLWSVFYIEFFSFLPNPLLQDHIHNMKELNKKRERLIAKAAQKKMENHLIEQELTGLQITVAERAHIHEAIGSMSTLVLRRQKNNPWQNAGIKFWH